MLNDITLNLPAYPMEELAKIRTKLKAQNVDVYDFGTGDPQVPTWEPIRESLKNAVPAISQYPSIRGCDELRDAIWGYCNRRFGINKRDDIDILPTNGSKEAVFHIALSLVGRGSKDHILFPNPGYPVYRSSALFARGIPVPVDLKESEGYIIQPWKLPAQIQKRATALWINYPHNPTGALINREQLEKIQSWCHKNDVILLTDDCYTDIYDSSWEGTGNRPVHILEIGMEKTLSFMSLSKRSGLTGYRSGFIIGDKQLIELVTKARANFGVATPLPIQKAATTAWQDDSHVERRRKIFSERMDVAFIRLHEMGLVDQKPQAGFYIWCRLPHNDDDVDFCLSLAKQGVICSPSQWLGDGVKGYVRFALVPELELIETAMSITKDFVTKRYQGGLNE